MFGDDDISEIFRQMIEFMFGATSGATSVRVIRPQTTRNVDVIPLDDRVIVVVVLREYTEDQISVDVYEYKGQKILKIVAGEFSRTFALTKDMSGKFDKGFRNGILEVIVYRDLKEE